MGTLSMTAAVPGTWYVLDPKEGYEFLGDGFRDLLIGTGWAEVTDNFEVPFEAVMYQGGLTQFDVFSKTATSVIVGHPGGDDWVTTAFFFLPTPTLAPTALPTPKPTALPTPNPTAAPTTLICASHNDCAHEDRLSGEICQADGSCTGCSATGLNECAGVYITGPEGHLIHLGVCENALCVPAPVALDRHRIESIFRQ